MSQSPRLYWTVLVTIDELGLTARSVVEESLEEPAEVYSAYQFLLCTVV